MNRTMQNIAKTVTDRSGSVFVKFALLLPVLLGVSLSAADYAWTLSHKSVLQDAADVAALAGAKELSLADSKRENVAAAVKALAERYIAANGQSLVKKHAPAPTVETKITSDPLEVEVTVTQHVEALVGGLFGLDFPDLKIRSVARVVGQPNICVLALDPEDKGTISLEHHAHVTGRNCAVYSNSTSKQGIRAKNDARLEATFICSRGGKDGSKGNWSPDPMVDCPAFDDPLAGRGEPSVGPCMATNLVINTGSHTLYPGTYCGGVKISNNALVSLASGTYVFKDGPLRVDTGGKIEGKGVGLFFKGGPEAVLDLANESSVKLEAQTTGEMAGLLVFASHSQDKTAIHQLLSNNAPLLLGTIYIPNGELRIDAEAPIAQDSAYTAIVARAMRLYGGPHLVLNTNYDKTDIPVPEGIKGAGQPASLVE